MVVESRLIIFVKIDVPLHAFMTLLASIPSLDCNCESSLNGDQCFHSTTKYVQNVPGIEDLQNISISDLQDNSTLESDFLTQKLHIFFCHYHTSSIPLG